MGIPTCINPISQGSVQWVSGAQRYILAPFIDTPMVYVKYLPMHLVQMHAGAIRKLFT